jgi:hypothetical protein
MGSRSGPLLQISNAYGSGLDLSVIIGHTWFVLQGFSPMTTTLPGYIHSITEREPRDGQTIWFCFQGVNFWQYGVFRKEPDNYRKFYIGEGPASVPATHWADGNILPPIE